MDERKRPKGGKAPANVFGQARFTPGEKGADEAPGPRQGLGSYVDDLDEAAEAARDAARDEEWRREHDEGFPAEKQAAAKREASHVHVAFGTGADERELADPSGSEARDDDPPAPGEDGDTGEEQAAWGQGGPTGSERHGAERYGDNPPPAGDEASDEEDDAAPGGTGEAVIGHRLRD